MNDALTIWQLADGKPGHENQSLGLIEAIGRIRPSQHHRIDISDAGNFWSRWTSAKSQAKDLPKAELIIGAGHATHFPLWCLRRASGARTVLLMKPSLPMGFFDLCIAPRHDFPQGFVDGENLLLTEGAINRVVAASGERQGRLILLGGPSKHHDWNADGMMKTLTELARDGEWQLTDSRRTPDGFVDRLRDELPQIEIHPHQETGPDWLPQILQQVEACWVSEDSVSMTYEAMSSGAQVGLLPVPRRGEDARVLRGLDRQLDKRRLMAFDDWLQADRVLAPAKPLREADRCAELLLDRLHLSGPF